MKKSWKVILLALFITVGCNDEFPTVPQYCPECPDTPDTHPPSRVTDLAVASQTDTTIVLTWTAPGDDMAEGRASFYDLRYTTEEDSMAQWSDECFIAPEKTPALSGETEEIFINDLHLMGPTFFGLRAADEDSNWSATSNVIIVDPMQPPCPLVISSPLSWASYCEGDTIDVLWERTECQTETVDLFLLHNGEVTQHIGDDVANTGQYHWASDPFGFNVDGYQIAVQQSDGSQWSKSTGFFHIYQGCAITVESPNGGEYLCRSENQQIYWSRSACCSTSVTVELLHNFTVIDTLENISSSGNTWNVSSPLEEESGYQIRVTDNATGQWDVSDYTFQIGSEHPPEIEFPNGGQVLDEENEVALRWDKGECFGGYVRIELEHDGEICLVVQESFPNTGTSFWMPSSAGASEEGYRIVVTDLSTGMFGKSESTFSIDRQCSFDYLGPASGSQFCAGEPMTITWGSGQWCGDFVKLEMYTNGTFYTIAEEAPNTGTFQWTTPSLPNQSYAVVSIHDLNSNYSVSGPNLTIYPAGSVTLGFPSGADTLIMGETVTIVWTTEGCHGPTVDLSLRQNGDVCLPIAQGVDATSGHYDWVVTRCGEEVSAYQIKIVNPTTGEFDFSYPPFSIEEAGPNDP
jgi:hypothetical protein